MFRVHVFMPVYIHTRYSLVFVDYDFLLIFIMCKNVLLWLHLGSKLSSILPLQLVNLDEDSNLAKNILFLLALYFVIF